LQPIGRQIKLAGAWVEGVRVIVKAAEIAGRFPQAAARIIPWVMVMALGAVDVAAAASPHDGVVLYKREGRGSVSSIFQLAAQGNPSAQVRLGFMYAVGQGVPQNPGEAAYWYQRAAEQGDDRAQYLLGLSYDKGHGVPHDLVIAHKWLNLSASRARGDVREHRVRVRDAIASRMTFGQIAQAEQLALQWYPQRDR
jgi:hypothetical protein